MKNRADDLARAYVEAHGLTAISVVENGGRLIFQIDTADETGRTRLDWKVTRPAAWWLPSAAAAKKVFDHVPAYRGQGDLDDLTRAVLLGADRAGVRVTDHVVLMQRAAQAVQLVEARLRDLKSAGSMKALNTEYKDLRLRRAETGKTIEPFWQWLHKRKVALVEQVARAASGKR